MNTIRPLFSKYMAGPLAVAAVAVAAAPADARPVIDSIDLERASATTARVEVELERSSVSNRPNVRVWVAGRSTTLRVVGRDEDGDILTARTLRWSTREYDRYRVRVRVCDRGTCTSMTRRVVVDDDGGNRDQAGSSPSTGSAITRERAARIARERFGGRVEAVWREDDFGALWEVELENARYKGARQDLDVYVNASGRVVRVIVDRDGLGGDDR